MLGSGVARRSSGRKFAAALLRLRGRGSGSPESGGVLTVKKLLVIALLGLSAFAVWRKVQADRAELDLWTEATTADE